MTCRCLFWLQLFETALLVICDWKLGQYPEIKDFIEKKKTLKAQIDELFVQRTSIHEEKRAQQKAYSSIPYFYRFFAIIALYVPSPCDCILCAFTEIGLNLMATMMMSKFYIHACQLICGGSFCPECSLCAQPRRSSTSLTKLALGFFSDTSRFGRWCRR